MTNACCSPGGNASWGSDPETYNSFLPLLSLKSSDIPRADGVLPGTVYREQHSDLPGVVRRVVGFWPRGQFFSPTDCPSSSSQSWASLPLPSRTYKPLGISALKINLIFLGIPKCRYLCFRSSHLTNHSSTLSSPQTWLKCFIHWGLLNVLSFWLDIFFYFLNAILW